MKSYARTSLAALGVLAAVAVPAAAGAQGAIAPLQRGSYVCEMPGDAAGRAGHPVPEASFSVVNASTYAKDGQRGSYLLRGDRVTMTSGPLKGASYERMRGGFLRKIEGGEAGRLRCVRR